MTQINQSPFVQAQLSKMPIRRHQVDPSAPKPRHFRALAEVLDVVLQEDTTLASRFEANPSHTLQSALSDLPASAQKILRQRLGNGTLENFISLSKEPDPKIFYHGVLRLAEDLEDKDDLRFAYRAYMLLAKQQTQFPDLREKARVRLAVITGNPLFGKAPLADRLHFLGDQYLHQTFKELPLLAAMGVGTAGLRLGRYAVARRLAPALEVAEGAAVLPIPSSRWKSWFFSAGSAAGELSLGHKVVSNLAGGALELAAFSGTHRGLEYLLDQPIEGDFGDELKAAAWILLPMHAGGFLGSKMAGASTQGLAKMEGALAYTDRPWLRRVSYPVTGPMWVAGKFFSFKPVQGTAKFLGSQLGMFTGITLGLSQEDPKTGLAKNWGWNVGLAQSLALLTQRNLAYGATSLLFRKNFRVNEAKMMGF